MTASSARVGQLDPFQAEVAKIALAATESLAFALAGGNALVAHGLLTRPTQDIDLFTSTPHGPGDAAAIVVEALRAEGLSVAVDVAPDREFARLQVSNAVAAFPATSSTSPPRSLATTGLSYCDCCSSATQESARPTSH